MSSQSKEVTCFEAVIENQEKLAKLGEKLDTLKKKYLVDKKHELLDYKYLLKEAERIDCDIKFIRSLLDGLKDLDSLTSRFFRKVLPGKSVSQAQDVSREFKTSVMAFSTKFFEDKVKYLEKSVKETRKNKQKSHRKKTTQEVCSSATHSLSEESTGLKKNDSADKANASKILRNNSTVLKPKEEDSQNMYLVGFKENEANENYFVSHSLSRHQVDKEIIRKPQLLLDRTANHMHSNSVKASTPCMRFSPNYLTNEKSVQTDFFNFIPKISSFNSCEKCVQTENLSQSYILNEILEALKKVGEVYSVPSGTPLYNTEDALSLSSAASSPSDLLLWRSSEAASSAIFESVVDTTRKSAINPPVSRILYDGLSEYTIMNCSFDEGMPSNDVNFGRLKGELTENFVNSNKRGPRGISRHETPISNSIGNSIYEIADNKAVEVKLLDLNKNDVDDILSRVLDSKIVDNGIKIKTIVKKPDDKVNMVLDVDLPSRIGEGRPCTSGGAEKKTTFQAVNIDSGCEKVTEPRERRVAWIPVEERKGLWSRTRESTCLMYPIVYHLKETVGLVENQEALAEEGNKAFQSLSVQLSRHQTAEENTLEIVYHHSPNKTGKIIVTEFGQTGTTTQSEIVGRIISYLIGLPPPNDKT